MNRMSDISPGAVESPHIQVSWGELVDRITILEIKWERLTNEQSRENVRREIERLQPVIQPLLKRVDALGDLKTRLRTINERLWDIENQIRRKEKLSSFDDEFVALARSVYTRNDERSAIKKAINDQLGCVLGEEKYYG